MSGDNPYYWLGRLGRAIELFLSLPDDLHAALLRDAYNEALAAGVFEGTDMRAAPWPLPPGPPWTWPR